MSEHNKECFIGGRAPADGYYWVKWRLRGRDEWEVEKIFEHFQFGDNTKWSGPLPEPAFD